VRDEIANAIRAATALPAIATSVVPDRPTAGISTKPASNAPTAAPAVLSAYKAPLDRGGFEDPTANHRTAIGNVAPSADAGTNTMTRHERSRIAGKSIPGVPSLYAHARTGSSAVNSNGSTIASMATPSSSAT